MEPVYPEQTLAVQDPSAALVKAYLNKVYLWMAASLLVTAGVAVYTARSAATLTWVLDHQWLFFIGIIGIVFGMGMAARALTSGALAVLLLVFAGLNGMIFGPLLTVYTQQSLGVTFGVTAGMFGAMGLYGACTKRELSGMGRTLFMVLIGLIIAGIVNIFLGNGLMDLIISAVGVVAFALFTAYDTQNIIRQGLCTDEELRRKGAIFGALTLYLDFINLFLYLLRFFGRSND